MEGIKYTEYEILLEPGDKLFLYTDGVPEATDADRKMFGTARMIEALNTEPEAKAPDVLENVWKAVRQFVAGEEQFDDLTMLCLEYNNRGPVMQELTLEAIVENINKVTEFVNGKLEKLGCARKIQYQIDVAIDELFGNIALYAYDPETGPATVRVEVLREPLAVVITFIDKGRPYDPLESRSPDITLSADDRPIGGLGVFLVKKTMDDISYEYKDGKNILRILKRL